MERYIPTGNEMVSLPKINEITAGIEDMTFLSMLQKGMIEVRGTQEEPLMQPFVCIDGKAVALSDMNWSREHFWLPKLTAEAGNHDFTMTILPPVGERGFAM
jgi:hypothetical protein